MQHAPTAILTFRCTRLIIAAMVEGRRTSPVFEHTSLGPQMTAGELGLTWATEDHNINVQLQRVSDAGSAVYIGTATRSASPFLEVSDELTPEQSRRANATFFSIVKHVLSGDHIPGSSYEREGERTKIRMFLPNNFDSQAVTIFFAQTSLRDRTSDKKIPVLVRLAACRPQEGAKIEKMLRRLDYRDVTFDRKRRSDRG